MIRNKNDEAFIKGNSINANRDPISGEPGSHPVGTAAGAASGALAGAAIGTGAGPIGTAAGAIIGGIVGGVAGGYAGKSFAELVNPTEVDAYWRENFSSRPYINDNADYETYKSAYKYGYDARAKHDTSFDDVEDKLSRDWDSVKGNSSLKWAEAKDAARDSYNYSDTLYRNKISNTNPAASGKNLNAQSQTLNNNN